MVSDVQKLVLTTADLLLHKNKKLVTIESCTGGWIAQTLTSLPGSSDWFERGFVTYSNESKNELVGVNRQTLNTHGAVSSQVALEMAVGGLKRSRADIAVSVTGIAGPDGGSPQKPLGTVWIGWADSSGKATSEHFLFSGDRQAVREASVRAAIEGVCNLVNSID